MVETRITVKTTRGEKKLRLLFMPFLLVEQKIGSEKVFQLLFSTVSYLIICRHVANREKLCEMVFFSCFREYFAIEAGKNNRNSKISEEFT